MWEDMLKNEEPDWKPQLRRILDEAKKHHKEASNAFFRLKKKLKEQNESEEVKDQIDIVDTFITYFPAGGATAHDLIMFLEEHVL
tara:strand:+ start:667 stop:921 length:255 start_codon:yes stop_codon:yes gene_type:complete